jgi:putative heme-binding domain-containing protein
MRAILLCVLCAFCGSTVAQQNTAAIEALKRLKGVDLESNPALKAAVLKTLEGVKGTPQFVELVRDFKLKGKADELLAFAIAHPADSLGVEAFRLAVADKGATNLSPLSAPLIELMGNTAEKEFVPILEPVIEDSKQDLALRKTAVKAMAQTEEGAMHLLKLASADKLDPALKFTASATLNAVHWPAIKSEAAKILPLPQGRNSSLPPVAELIKMKGDVANGQKIFRRQEINCIGCHQVNGEGADIGPALSEIGTKLAREALYESILDPSSGISFGYEAWQIELKNGEEAFGLITSDSGDEITLKTQLGISTKHKKSEIARRTQLKDSIMPQGLQAAMSTQELVDLVEYLSSLKKK